MVRKSSITVNYMAFQEALSPTLIEVIEALQRCKGLPTLSEIARQMNMSPSNLWKIINKLRERGFAFSADIDLAKLGLYRCFIFLDKFVDYDEVPFKEALRAYVEIMPRGTLLSYYVPYDKVDQALSRLKSELDISDDDNVFIVEESFLSKPILSMYFDLEHRNIIYNWEAMKKIYELRLKEPEPSLSSSVRIDTIDVKIVRELEIDPFASVKEISRKIGEDYGRVRWHFLNHVVNRGIVRGIRLRLPPMQTIFASLAIIRNDPRSLYALARTLTEHPAFSAAHLSIRSKTLLVVGSVPPEEMRSYAEFLDQVAKHWDMVFLNVYSLQSFTVPFGRFSPLEGWRLFVDSS